MFNINKAIQETTSDSTSSGSSFFQKIFNDEAPTIGYISSKAPTEFVLVPPHGSYGSSQTMTASGSLWTDPLRGTMPYLGQYGMDRVIVYKKIGNSSDQKGRKDILAINMLETDDGLKIQVEQEWGKGYKSPMYKLHEFLWKTGGGHKYNKTARRVEMSLAVDTSSWQYKRALELLPVGNELGSPMSRGARTLFLQGFLAKAGGISYTKGDDGQACWPKHKILMINQVSAMKSRENERIQEGFYDMWFERNDGVPLDSVEISRAYGDVEEDPAALAKWESHFVHSDYTVNQKLLTFKAYPSGPAGISTYACSVSNLTQTYGENYILPDEVLKQARPFSEYILMNNEQLQTEWLQELFPGDEWALIGAGIIPDSGNKVFIPGTPTAPKAAIPAPAVKAPPAAIPVPVPTSIPTPKTSTPPSVGAPKLSEQMSTLLGKMRTER